VEDFIDKTLLAKDIVRWPRKGRQTHLKKAADAALRAGVIQGRLEEMG